MLHHTFRNYGPKAGTAWLAVAALLAAEHHGVVRSGGMPLPGATVTATQGDRKLVTTTGDQGAYAFSDLPDGAWDIQVDMLGFANERRQLTIAPGANAEQWTLRMLNQAETDAIVKNLTAPAPGAQSATAQQPAAAPSPAQPESPQAVQSAANAPGRGASASAPQRGGAAQNNSARNTRAGQPQAQAGRGGRGLYGNPNQPGFQQVAVNQSAESSEFNQEGIVSSDQAAELSPSANTAFVVQGSMSSALGMQAMNDWGPFGGRGMEPPPDGGPGMMGPGGMGGPGGIPGMEGGATAPQASLDNPGAPAPGPGGGAPGGGGPGGRGGGMMGGGPGGPGGGPGGRGGGMAGPGGRGGRGGDMAAGRGGRGPAWMGRGGAMAFGNNRRNPAMMYTGSFGITERNSILNAKSYSLTGQSIDKPYLNNTNITASLGGPLAIPKLSQKSHGQFTINLSVGRNRNGQTSQLTTMPSALERMGDFSQSVTSGGKSVTIYDPLTNAPFAGNVIPASRQSSIALSLLKYYPNPNLTGATRNFQSGLTSFSDSNSVNMRISPRLSATNNINGGFNYQGSSSTSPNIFGFKDTGSGRGMSANFSFRHSFTNRKTATVNVNFSRQRQQALPFFAYVQNVAGNLGINGVSTDPINWGPPTLSFTNFAGLSDGAASLLRNQTLSVQPTLMWVHKTHNISVGAEFRRQQNNTLSSGNARGSFTFNGYATSLIQNAAAVSGTGFDLADFLLGTPDTATIRYTTQSLYFRGSSFSANVQDDWRMRPRFSVNIGLRWEFQQPWIEKNDRLVNLAIGPNFTSVAQVQPNQTDPFTGKQLNRSLTSSSPANFAPRFGFAWRPSEKHSTVLRGGYGVYYNPSQYSGIASGMSQQPPLAQAWNLSILSSNLTLADAFVNPSSKGINTLTSNTFAIDPNYRVGYAQSWNLSLQQSLPFSFMTQASYTGTKGTQLTRQFQPWVMPAGSTVGITYPSGYTYETFGGNSIYHGVSASLMRRFSAGVQANATYTFSKMIDDTSQAQNWLNFRAERALSDQDRRHNLGISFQYSTGQGRRGGGTVTGFKGHLLRDWSIQTNATIGSGSPLTVTMGGNQIARGTTSGVLRADATGVSIKPLVSGQHFNPAAFAVPAAGTWGSSGRNVIPGPMAFTLNASAGRGFRFGERRRMDIRLNANNVLNTVVVTRWNTVLGANTFGQPTNVNAMRSVNATLRFNF